MATLTSTVVRAGGFMVSEAVRHRAREQIVVLSGQVLKAGHVLGKIMVGATAVAAAAAGNTGNGAMGSVTAGAAARNGTYQLLIIEAATNAGRFQVTAPNGIIIGTGSVGAAFSGGGLSFTLADGATDFVAGDRFSITVTPGTEKYKEYNPANTDGSQTPAGILWDAVDATSADKPAAAVVRACEVNQEELVWFSGATGGQKTAGIKLLAEIGILVRKAV